MRRAVFPRWLYRHVSFKVDIFFLLFNVFIFGLLFGWALLSMQFFSRTTSDALAGFFGLEQQNTSASLTTKALITLALFFAYELGYWTYHYLSHKIPFLWGIPVAVGTRITARPPHRTVRAAFPHTAPTSGV